MSAAAAPGGVAGHPLLRDAILPTLWRLSLPNMVAMGMSVLVAVAETYYVGRLGTTALAAMALVFPLAMLTQMMSNGAMGSGVSSAISRALGSGDRDKASALAVHALVIGGVVGVLYSMLLVLCGSVFYRWLGGRGEVLQAATGFGANPWDVTAGILILEQAGGRYLPYPLGKCDADAAPHLHPGYLALRGGADYPNLVAISAAISAGRSAANMCDTAK